MAAPPSEDDVDMLDTVLTSWFVIGRLGGYNSMNLQAKPLISPHEKFASHQVDLLMCLAMLLLCYGPAGHLKSHTEVFVRKVSLASNRTSISSASFAAGCACRRQHCEFHGL